MAENQYVVFNLESRRIWYRYYECKGNNTISRICITYQILQNL